MNSKSIPLQKITIQKVIYYLKEVGVPLKYKYEPYIYGPYSSELKADLRNMILWDELKIYNNNNYDLNDKFELTDIGNEYLDNLSSQLDKFSNAINNDFSFDSMEVNGTVIYCHQALKNIGLSPTEDQVLKEFKNWKGDRYTDDEIKSAYSKMAPLLA